MSTENKLTLFLDSIGRTLMGEIIETTDQTVRVKNPIVIDVVHEQASGKVTLQMLPLFFREFLHNSSDPLVWSFTKSRLTFCENGSVNNSLAAQYTQIFSTQPPRAVSQDTIKLFED